MIDRWALPMIGRESSWAGRGTVTPLHTLAPNGARMAPSTAPESRIFRLRCCAVGGSDNTLSISFTIYSGDAQRKWLWHWNFFQKGQWTILRRWVLVSGEFFNWIFFLVLKKLNRPTKLYKYCIVFDYFVVLCVTAADRDQQIINIITEAFSWFLWKMIIIRSRRGLVVETSPCCILLHPHFYIWSGSHTACRSLPVREELSYIWWWSKLMCVKVTSSDFC